MTAPDTPIGAMLQMLARETGVGVALVGPDMRYRFVNPVLAAINRRSPQEHIGRTLAEVIPEIADTVEALHREVFSTGEAIRAVRIQAELGGTCGTYLANYHPLELPDGTRAVGAVVTDISEQAQAEVLAARRAAQQTAVAQLGQTALSGGDIQTLSELACSLLSEHLGVELAKVLELEPDGRLHLRAGTGWSPGLVGRARVDGDASSQAGYTLLRKEPVVVSDLRIETRFSGPELLLEHGVRSGMSVVIRRPEGSWGVLGVHTTTPHAFSEDDLGFLQSIANVLGAAVDRERTDARLRRVAADRGKLVAEALDAADRERRRISELLHDEALQTLLFTRQELTGARGGEGPVSLDRVAEGLDASIVALRRAVAEVHPVVLAHGGLAAGLEALGAEQGARGGYAVEVFVEAGAPSRHDALVLTLVRELLTNASKHAQARRVVVDVSRARGRAVRVSVADDGVGYDLAAVEGAVTTGHVGLASCFQRAEALGGSGSIGTGLEGRGTRVTVLLPDPPVTH